MERKISRVSLAMVDIGSSILNSMPGQLIRQISFTNPDSSISKSLDYWSRHNPLLMADEVYLESRGVWQSKTDFIISSVSFAIGLANMWRFPYMCLKFGCGSFLVVYTLFVIAIGIPLSLLETSLAQFTSAGVTQCWRFCPGFKGIGYAMMIVSLCGSFYYNLVLAWSLFYFLNSIRLEIPFLNCMNVWNDKKCISLLDKGSPINGSEKNTAAEQFWYRYVTTQFSLDGVSINGIGSNPDTLVWYTTSCLIIGWCITAFIMTKGIKVSSKKGFISIVWPICVIITFVVLSSLLPGSKKGLLLLMIPTTEGFRDLSTYYAAAEQLFFSFGIGFGGIITMGSYNRFHYNIQRDTILICVANYVTSCLCALISFLILGFISNRYSKSMKDIISVADLGFVFTIFPECCAFYSYPQLTNAMFFITLFIIGFDSILVMMETVVTGLIDIFPALNETQYHRICFVLILHFGCVIFSMIFVTKVGYNWFLFFARYGASANVMVIGLMETIIVVFVYKLKNFYRDSQMMVSTPISVIWKVNFLGIIPWTLIVALFFGLTANGQITFKTRDFPIWADVLGWIFLLVTVLPIPVFYVCYLLYVKMSKELTLTKAFRHTITPDIKWGPMKKRKWLLDKYYEERLLIIKGMVEEMKKNDTYATGKQRFTRFNLLSDTLDHSIKYEDSHSKDSDVLSQLPFEINLELLKTGNRKSDIW